MHSTSESFIYHDAIAKLKNERFYVEQRDAIEYEIIIKSQRLQTM